MTSTINSANQYKDRPLETDTGNVTSQHSSARFADPSTII